MSTKLIIDTDTGSDDAVALVLAYTDPRVEVLATTVVSGNVPLALGLQNALYTAELCGSTAPVYAGADRPLLREAVYAQDVHGADGMGDIGLPLTGRVPAPGHAADVLIDLAHRHPGEITLVTLGPLTNLALALRKDPEIAGLFDRVVMMAGAGDHIGNIKPTAEFNIYVDPEAADIVYTSGLPLEMVGWDVSRKDATLTEAENTALTELGPLGVFCADIQRQLIVFCREVTKVDGIDFPDPVTMAYAIDPTLATEAIDAYVRVETTGTHTLGMTIVDRLGVLGEQPNTRVVLGADHDRFVAMLREACSRPVG